MPAVELGREENNRVPTEREYSLDYIYLRIVPNFRLDVEQISKTIARRSYPGSIHRSKSEQDSESEPGAVGVISLARLGERLGKSRERMRGEERVSMCIDKSSRRTSRRQNP